MSTIPTIDLNDGTRIPQLGFGVFQIEPDETAQSVQTALEIGYRHIDTAEMYQNEAGVGQGIRDAGLDRAEVYITSKLNNGYHKPDDARRAFDADAREARLRLCRPVPHPLAAADALRWRLRLDMANARGVQEGRTRPQHRGVQLPGRPLASGWHAKPTTTPAVNQIEVHPYFTNDSVRAYGAEHGIATEAWSPIAQGQVLGDPVVKRIAEATGRTPAQVVLRWHIQRGDIVFPKSVTPQRIKENFEIVRLQPR